jgi:GNAT superfamily N-acetyltransferase
MPVTIQQVDVRNKKLVNQFVMYPWKIYQGHPQWVPPIIADIKAMLNPDKHPFYEHSEADFFLAQRNGELVGRIAALENKRYNQEHDKKQAQFYLFDCIEDQEVANALFGRVFEWAKQRGLNQVVGPKGLSSFDGYGIQIEGFQHRQMMVMMNYNYAYYRRLVEALDFRKEVDFVSTYVHIPDYEIPERVVRIAERIEKRGKFSVKRFENRKELRKWAKPIGYAYNKAFVNNWEYYPLTDNEINFVLNNLLTVADPKLIKIILYEDQIVGFILGFPDVSAGLQKANGRLFPGIIPILLDMKRTDWISMNGIGILPEYQGHGGNALFYAEMTKTIKDYGFKHCELTQMAETATEIRSDIISLNTAPYKNHRVFIRDI